MSAGVRQHGDENGALEAADIHDVLRNDRRRLTLERLRTEGTGQSVSSLAEHIASVESGADPPPKNVRQSVYVSLHQTHLPKLDDLGIVDYDSTAKDVVLAEHADEVAVYMEVVPKYGLSWGEYYLGVGLLGLLTLFGAVSGVPILASVESALLGWGFLALVVLSAVYQIASQRSSLLHRLQE